MYWYLKAHSLHGFPPLGPSPWRWELAPRIQSLGNQQHQQQKQQCPVSTILEQLRQREMASCSCMWVCTLKREYQWIYRVLDLKALNSALKPQRCLVESTKFQLWVQWRKYWKYSNHTPKVNNFNLDDGEKPKHGISNQRNLLNFPILDAANHHSMQNRLTTSFNISRGCLTSETSP